MSGRARRVLRCLLQCPLLRTCSRWSPIATLAEARKKGRRYWYCHGTATPRLRSVAHSTTAFLHLLPSPPPTSKNQRHLDSRPTPSSASATEPTNAAHPPTGGHSCQFHSCSSHTSSEHAQPLRALTTSPATEGDIQCLDKYCLSETFKCFSVLPP